MLTPDVMETESDDSDEDLPESTSLMQILQSFNHGYQEHLETLRSEEMDRKSQRQ